MKLKTAVSIPALLLSGVFCVLSFALIKTTDLLDFQSREIAKAGESIRVAQSLKNRLLTHNRNSFLYELNNDPSRFASRQKQRDEIVELLIEAEQLINNDEEKLVFDSVRHVTHAYLAKRDSLDDQPESSERKYMLASIDVDNAISAVDQLVSVNQTQMEQLSSAIRERNNDANAVAGILFVVGAIILTGVVFAAFTFIARPLTDLARVITRYSEGGVSARVEPRGVTEIKTVSANFNAMTERLEEKRQDQLRFIASIAHDLRNPLNSMSIITELLLSQEQVENRQFLEVIFRQARHLDRLVNDLLDTAHIESGHLALNLSQQDIRILVQDAVELHRTASDLHHFEMELTDETLICQCDSGRLSQVVNNLLSNAIKYSPNGGVITVRA